MSKQNQGPDYQNRVLGTARAQKIPTTIILTNGFRMQGIVRGFDPFVVILQEQKSKAYQMLYKHAISTVIPADNEVLKKVIESFSEYQDERDEAES